MPVRTRFAWTPEVEAKLAEHDVTPEEFEEVYFSPHSRREASRSSGRPLVVGRTQAGRLLICVYEQTRIEDELWIDPVTAYEP